MPSWAARATIAGDGEPVISRIGNLLPVLPQVFRQFKPGHQRHVVIQDQAADPVQSALFQELHGGREIDDGISCNFQQEPHRVAHRGIVIDQCNCTTIRLH